MRHLDDYEHRFLEILAKGLEARARSKAEGKRIVYGNDGFTVIESEDDGEQNEKKY